MFEVLWTAALLVFLLGDIELGPVIQAKDGATLAVHSRHISRFITV